MPDTALRLRWIAAAGALVWLGLLLVDLSTDAEVAFVERMLLFAPLVTVPLGLSLVPPLGILRAAPLIQPLAAAALVGSLLVPRGAPAAALAVPWLTFTGLVALGGLLRALRRGLRPLQELCVDAGLLYLPIGGAWLVAARLGIRPLGFSDTIVLLTAVHFHYAGHAAPVLAGLAGRAIAERRPPPRTYAIAGGAAIAGPPLVAIGITVSPLVEVLSALLLASGLVVLSVLTATMDAPALRRSRATVPLLVVSSTALVVTMALAVTYALGEYLGRAFVTIPQMARSHGVANVFGFTTCGLLAWTLGPPGTARER